MENEVKKIGGSAGHCTGTINGHGIRGGIRIRPESAPTNPSCVAPMNLQLQAHDYQGGRALS
jgi:hypothetical protein